jgi:hypothetical protein
MLSFHVSAYPQPGQRDPGETTDCFSGRRWMQTFRKLPTHSPHSTKNVP